MLTYSLVKRKNESLYEFFYNCMRKDIIDGVLKAGEKLPSKRDFARNHGVSIITVENTYGQLAAEGYIYSKPKSGFYVANIQSHIISEDVTNGSVISTYADSDISNRASEDKSDKAISLISNHTDKECFPFSVWAKINRQILSEQDSKLLTPPPMGGVVELREAIAKHLRDFRGINVSHEQIIIGAGTEYLYNLIVQLLGRDKIYGLENPSSKKIRRIYEVLGVKVMPLEMDEEGIKLTPENLAVPEIIQISPSHHFPTGTVTSVSRRYGLLQWANEVYDRYIIEDDFDSEFRLQGKPIPSLFSMDTTDKVIYFNTFTKSLASTIRISYMVLPQTLLNEYKKKLGVYSCTVSNFEQYVLAEFISERYFEKHINRMRNHYRNLRDKLIELICKSKIASKVRISEENSGLHFLLHINTKYRDEELKEMANKRQLTLSFLSDYLSYDFGANVKGYERVAIINYSGLNEDILEEVVTRLESAWENI